MILDALKFVQRAVARTDNTPGLTTFRIKDDRVTAFNGLLAMSAPLQIGFDCAPAAVPFLRALSACKGPVMLRQESHDRVQVASGTFKASVPCVPVNAVPTVQPVGDTVTPNSSFVQALATLQPFIGSDVTKQWSTGVLFSGDSAFATNNLAMVQYYLGGTGFPFPVNLPAVAVSELLRIRDELTHAQVSPEAVTFHYPDGRWLRTGTLSLKWPDVSHILNPISETDMKPVPKGLADACETLVKVSDRSEAVRIFFQGDKVSNKKNGLAEDGATVDVPGVPVVGCYRADLLRDVLAVAQGVNFSTYPQAATFTGHLLRGALVASVPS